MASSRVFLLDVFTNQINFLKFSDDALTGTNMGLSLEVHWTLGPMANVKKIITQGLIIKAVFDASLAVFDRNKLNVIEIKKRSPLIILHFEINLHHSASTLFNAVN